MWRRLTGCAIVAIAISLPGPGWGSAAAASGGAASLAAVDLDEDGRADLVGGFADPAGTGGALRWTLGSTTAPTAIRKLTLPLRPDFLVTGDFDADGHDDVAVAERQRPGVLLLTGNGAGDLTPNGVLAKEFSIEALLTADVNRSDGLADLVLSGSGARGPALLVLESPLGASRAEVEEFPLDEAATAIAAGRFSDDPFIDVAVASAGVLHIIRGRDRRLGMDSLGRSAPVPAEVRSVKLPSRAEALLAGRFGREDGTAQDLLVLLEGGTLALLEASAADVRPLSAPALLPPLLRAKLTSATGDQALGRLRASGAWNTLVPGAGVSAGAAAWRARPVGGGEAAALLALPSVDRGLHQLVAWTDAERPPAAAPAALLATFVVNTLADTFDVSPGDGGCADSSGFCSLRGAIQETNALTGADTIIFSLGAGTPTIVPQSPLPPIVETVSILGSTGGATRLELAGNLAGSGAVGLRLTTQGALSSGGSLIQALAINRFAGPGIVIETSSNRIEACYIGTDADGSASGPGNGEGILLVSSSAAGNTIGGTTATLRNVISANGAAGVRLDAGAHSNSILGNVVGATRFGTTALPNGGPGVAITGGANANRIGGTATAPGNPPGNLLSGNAGGGVLVSTPGTSGNQVQGNLIGVAAGGAAALGNLADGVRIRNGASGNLVGGSAVSLRNVISANGPATTADGIEINGGSFNSVRGNIVGLDILGAVPLGNAGDGIAIRDSDGPATGNVIGSAGSPFDGDAFADSSSTNTSSANGGSGVKVSGTASTSNTVANNNVGTTSSGVVTIVPGNLGDGIVIEDGASQNVVGGTLGVTPGACSGACNRIAHSEGVGVVVRGSTSLRNTIRGNVIASNSALGIDLGYDGPTQNDPGDVDLGPNELQNFPIIEGAFFDGGFTQIDVRVGARPETTYDVELFSNQVADDSGFGEGRNFLGSYTATTDPSGVALFRFAAAGNHRHLSATATDASGNTSEFSPTFSNPGEARQLLQSRGPGSLVIAVYAPACAASDHALYWGITPFAGGVNWIGVACGLGTSGTATYDPGTPPSGKAFYAVVVGQSTFAEGSYGNGRPEAVFPAACDRPQQLTVVCP